MATGPGNPLNITGTGAISFNGTVFSGGTLPVIYGGTGATSFTAYSVICGGTTSTAHLQNVSGVGTSGQVLMSNGAGALPSWASSSSGVTTVNMQVFASNGTYTPTANMAYCIVEVCGGGGGGGGAGSNSSSTNSMGGGGGGGGYIRQVFSAATIGAGQGVTIGAGGLAGSNTGGNGGNGGTTSLGGGPLLFAQGGFGGQGSGGVSGGSYISTGGSGGGESGGVGTFFTNGGPGSDGFCSTSINLAFGGAGGDCFLGAGGGSVAINAAGIDGVSFGGGGGGACGNQSSGGFAGGVGKPGICIITEFIT